jgi:acyl-CoA thioester hydrolase
MTDFSSIIAIRWSDIDANYHMKHSSYYDFGAQKRMEALSAAGLTMKVMQENHVGPVLFREEALFKREIRFEDKISIDIRLLKLKRDFSKFSIQHYLVRDDGTLCAIITVDGAWIDTKIRQVVSPPQIVLQSLNLFPKAENFEWID